MLKVITTTIESTVFKSYNLEYACERIEAPEPLRNYLLIPTWFVIFVLILELFWASLELEIAFLTAPAEK